MKILPDSSFCSCCELLLGLTSTIFQNLKNIIKNKNFLKYLKNQMLGFMVISEKNLNLFSEINSKTEYLFFSEQIYYYSNK